MTIITNGRNKYEIQYFIIGPTGQIERDTKFIMANTRQEAEAILQRQLNIYHETDRRWSYSLTQPN